MGLEIPTRFGGVKPIQKPYRAQCGACGDLGTVVLRGNQREARTMPEIKCAEAPCTCQRGDLWRKLFEEFEKSLAKCGEKAAA